MRILGQPDLAPLGDPPSGPFAGGASLMRLRDILGYCERQHIRMYRLHSNMAPQAASEQALAALWCTYAHEAALLADRVQALDMRLSFHPYSSVSLACPDEARLTGMISELAAQAAFLDALATSPESVIVLHVGGSYDDKPAALARFSEQYSNLPEAIRRRVVLEHDDRLFSVADVLEVSRQCGVPLVFDWQHHLVLNPTLIPWQEAIARCVASWPAGVTPKIHFSSPRTEMSRHGDHIKAPSWTEHADFIQPFELIGMLRETAEQPYDVMLEAKARDLALKKLREDLTRYAPDMTVA
ncbi:MAG: UV DNA damage repair endonuclease UvsE [Chloroflexi bacterium]|nr:UV DNA damage repair endonuclease UvsE [Chloroflexota bacterium]